jgi:hypothetical protein
MAKLRTDAYYDLQAIINDGLERIAEENHIYKCCFNCGNVDLQNNKCKKWNATPPIRVITFGCKDWEDKDGIPF